MYKFGTVILAQVQYMETSETKIRPALILYHEEDNIVVAGITSNTNRKGITLTKKEGAIKNSVIRLNYIFTISNSMIIKPLFQISNEKKKQIVNEINQRLNS